MVKLLAGRQGISERLAGLKASNRNKVSQIARLIHELAAARGQLKR